MVTLKALCRLVAEELGGYSLVTTTGAAASDATNALRTLLASELINDDAAPSRFNDAYAYLASGPLAGQQKPVRRNGHTGATGLVLTAADFTAIPPVGTEVEIHSRLPRLRADGVPGLRAIANQALGRLWFPHELSYTATSLWTYAPPSWLQSQSQILRLRDPIYGGYGVPLPSGRAANLVYGAGGYSLEISAAYSVGSVFYLDVWRPTNTWIRANAAAASTVAVAPGPVTAVTVTAGGANYTAPPAVTFSGGGGTGAAGTAILTNGSVTSITVTAGGAGYTGPPAVTLGAAPFGDSSAGLVSDTDEAIEPAPNAAYTLMMMLACRALAKRGTTAEQSGWAVEEDRWALKAAAFKQWGAGSLATPLATGAPPLTSWAKNWEPGR